MTLINQNLRKDFRRKLGLDQFRAVTGGTDGSLDVPGQPGYVFVSYLTAQGQLSAKVAVRFKAVVPKTISQPVIIGYDQDSVLSIIAADFATQEAVAISPLSNNPADPNVVYYIDQARITTLNAHVISSATPSMLVTVEPFLYTVSGTFHQFTGGDGSGGTIDLTSYIPGSANEQCIVCLFLDLAAETIEIQASTPKSTSDPLGIDDVQECMDAASAGVLAIWSFRLYNGQVGITTGNLPIGDDFLDLRVLVNLPDSGGGSGTVTSVALATNASYLTVSGSPVTTSGTLTANKTTGLTGNQFVGTPDGTTGAADLRALVNADIPSTLSGKTLTSPVINTGVSGTAIDNDPTLAANSSTLLATQQAVKSYVDAVATGLSPKNACKLATTAALPTNTYSNGSSGVGATITAIATGVLTVDSVTVALNDRVLVKDEVTQANNGIYLCTLAGAIGVAFILTRTVDFNQPAEIPGAYTFIEAGTVNTAAGFVCTNSAPPTIGSTAITFTQFSGAGEITAGTGLSKSGNTLSLQTPVALANGGTHADLSATGGAKQFLKQSSSGANITVGTIAASDLPDTAVTPGSYTNMSGTVDQQGRLTAASSGAAPVTSVAATAPLASSGGATPTISIINPVVAWRQGVVAASTVNVNIASAPSTLNGVTLTSGDRILLKDQSTGSQNGIWQFNSAASALTRPTDYAAGSTVLAFAGLSVMTYGSNSNSGIIYVLTTTGTITIDTTSTTWTAQLYNLASVAGFLAPLHGGFGSDFSGSTGAIQVAAGTFSAGTISIANGGTGQISKTNAFNALSPNTTKGDIVTHDGTNSVRQAVGSNLQRPVADSTQTNGWNWTFGGQEILIANTRLGSDSTISLSSFSSAFKHLILILQLRSDRAAQTNDGIKIQFNADTGSNYSWVNTRISEAGTSAGAQGNATTGIIPNVCVPGNTGTTGFFGAMVVWILNYNNTSEARFVTATWGFSLTSSTFNTGQFYGVWNNTANAITSITIAPSNGTNFKTGSSYELFGIG